MSMNKLQHTFKAGSKLSFNQGYAGGKGSDRLKDFRFAQNVHMASPEQSKFGGESVVKRQVSIEKFNQDNKKIEGNKFADVNRKVSQSPSIADHFLDKLLRPKDFFNPSVNETFGFSIESIIELCDQAENILKNQPIVLRVQAPIKIFGDIHGQYSDLMRFFDLFGSPGIGGTIEGDIDSFDYLFLGDFVDRGNHSLETICLLLALKVKYPDQIHLLRGGHEDRRINIGFGFADECAYRLQEDPDEYDSAFNKFNAVFDWLPLAAIVDHQILCLHGGIGEISKIEDIEKLQRPLEIVHDIQTAGQKLLLDVLSSNPTDHDQIYGIERNPGQTGNIVKFGPDYVERFLEENDLSLLIRGHECVSDGFERFAGGKLITLFSATDYCGRHKNAGAVLILKKNLEIIPKLIYPRDSNVQNSDHEGLRKRPPTPSRWKHVAPRKNSFD